MSSIQRRARGAGAVYLVMSLVGVPALLFVPNYFVADDAAESARRIAAGAETYRLIVLGDLAAGVLFAVLGWSLYNLFENVDRRLARLLLSFVLISATFGMLDAVLLSSPLVLQTRAHAIGAFTGAQIDALALVLHGIRGVALAANEILWGLWLVPFGLLVIKSGFIPKVIGVLLLVASVGYVAMSAAYIAFPAYTPIVNRGGMLLAQCELPVIFWLLIVGARTSAIPAGIGEATENAASAVAV